MLPLILTLIVLVLFITVSFVAIYVSLTALFKSLAEQKKYIIFFYYGAIIPLIYIFYLPILKIGGVDNLISTPLIFSAYVISIGFASIPRFFIFIEKPKEAEYFLFVLSTAIFLALAVIMTGYTAPNNNTIWSDYFLPNKLAYFIVWLGGIIVGLINEYLIKPIIEVLIPIIEGAIEKRKKP